MAESLPLTCERHAYYKLQRNMKNQEWRLNSFYFIKDKDGNKVRFKMNWAQRKLLKDKWCFNVILKARRLGCTTFIMLLYLDSCLFKPNQSAGVIAHTKEDATDLFNDKVKFAYDNLPALVKEALPAKADSVRELIFSNGSRYTVGTSLRSGTYQYLLVSEYGKLSAKYPEKAREVKTGALNTVTAGQTIFIESTAEGKSGEFYDICQQAQNLQAQGKTLTRLEPKFHFFSWMDNPDHRLNDDEVRNTVIPQDVGKYLDQFPQADANQRAWYAAKVQVMGDDMRREFCSVPSEAFEGSLEGAFYTQEMQAVRKAGGICRLPYDAAYPVSTFWDLGGARDQFSIWFYQYIKRQHRFINYHESNGNGWNFYAKLLNDFGYVYDKHYMPHDANTRRVGREIYTTVELAEQVGIKPIEVIPVTKSVYDDIRNYCKPFLPQCLFDEVNCALGIQRLDNYRKRWDDINGMWMNEAVHDNNSHGADSWRTAAVALKDGNPSEIKPSQYSILGNEPSSAYFNNSPTAWMGR